MSAILTADERMARAKGIRRLAIMVLVYHAVLLPVTVPLLFLGWLGGVAQDVFDRIDLPAYRWRSAQEELQRELIRDNRRKAAAARGDEP